MPFVTKPDFSNNRQVKQFQLSTTQLSGTTVFGVDDVFIPINFTGDTINVDALQNIRTRGLIFPNPIPQFTGATYQLLGRDNSTGKVVEVDGLSGGTSGVTSTDYVNNVSLSGTSLQFDGIGNAFNSSVDLTSLGSGSNTDDYTTGVTFNNQILEFDRLSGGTYSVDTSNLTWQRASSTFGGSSSVIENLIPGQADSFTSTIVHNGPIMTTELVANDIKNKGFAGLDIRGTGAGGQNYSIRLRGSNPNNSTIYIGDITSDINQWNPISEPRKDTIILQRSFRSTVGATETSVGDYQLTGIHANNPVNLDTFADDPNTYYAAFESNPTIEGTYLAANPQQIFALRGKGRVLLSDYGSGNVTGTTTYGLGVDASGNVIETTATGGTSTDYVNNVSLSGTSLQFTGIGSAFTGNVELASITDIPIGELATTQIIDIGNIGAGPIEDGWNAFTFTGADDPVQDQIDGYVLVETIENGLAAQYLFVGTGGTYGTTGTLTATTEDFTLLESDTITPDIWRDNAGVNQALTYTQTIRHGGQVRANSFMVEDADDGGIIKNRRFDNLLIQGYTQLILRGANPNNSDVRITSNGAITAYDADRFRYNTVIGRDYTSTVPYTSGARKTLVGLSLRDNIFINDATHTANMDYVALYIHPNVSAGSETDKIFSIFSDSGNVVFNNGDFTLGEISFPNTDGTVGQVLKTNGSGVLTWQDEAGAGTGGQVNSVVAGTNITIDNTDPVNPIISSTGGSTEWNTITGDQTDVNLIGFTDGQDGGLDDFVSRTASEANGWGSVTYGNGLFVAVSRDGTNRVMTSVDGITWTARSASEANLWFSVTYGNGLFVAVAAFGTNRVMTSVDGVTWVARSATEANFWTSVTYGNGLFVAVAAFGTNRVMTSVDGVTWVARSASEASFWYSVTYGNGLFVAVASSGTNRVMTSVDGVTWTARSASEANSWTSVTYGNGLFVAVAATGTNRVMTSPDGVTWTARSASEANEWQSVTYGDGLFVAVGDSGTNRVMTSVDGVTWTAKSATEPNPWSSVTYGDGLFVAVSQDGTNQVMTAELLAETRFENTVNEYQVNGVTVEPVNKVLNIEVLVNPTLENYTFATLPTPSTGKLAVINDASAITYRANAAGGGTDVALVMYDGTNWIYH